jgi:hypothetical protein
LKVPSELDVDLFFFHLVKEAIKADGQSVFLLATNYILLGIQSAVKLALIWTSCKKNSLSLYITSTFG